MAGPSTSHDYRDPFTVIPNDFVMNSTASSQSRESIPIDIPTEPRNNEENIPDLTEDEKIEIAATLINEAIYGRNGAFEYSPKQVKFYNKYNTWSKKRFVIRVVSWLYLALAIVEKPAVNGVELPFWGTMIVESFFMFVFGLCLFLRWKVAPKGDFRKDKKNVIAVITIIVTFIDTTLNAVFIYRFESEAFRLFRILRPVFVVCLEERQIRRAFRNIRRTIVGFINVLLLLLLAIGLFTLLATKLFQNHRHLKDIDGNPYFQKYFESYYQLYIFTTTANSPDVGIPAYDSSNWFALFFLIFFVICSYLFLSILLAVVYEHYKIYLRNEIEKSISDKRRHLSKAFRFIVDNEKKVLKFETWKKLLKVLFPKYEEEKVNFLWQVLRHENNKNNGENEDNNYIKMNDFIKVSELLQMEVIEVKVDLCSLRKKIRKIVRNKYFLYIVDVVIFVNAIFIALSVDLEIAEIVFLGFFLVELLLKMFTYGCREFFHMDLWNVFDFLLIIGATISFGVGYSMGAVTESEIAYDFLLILLVLRLINFIRTFERFKSVVDSIIQIGSSLAICGGMMFLLLYIYAILGMELFQGRIRMLGYPNATANVTELFCGDVRLKNSAFFNEHYCGENFNDILKSLKILFDLMIVNQWHILAQGFVVVTSKAARFYFVSFHLICVVLVLNIFVAFILEVFTNHYPGSSSNFKSELEKVIHQKRLSIRRGSIIEQSSDNKNLEAKSESGRKSETQKKKCPTENKPIFRFVENQTKSTEKLLQQMFEEKMGYEDVGEFEI